MVINMAREVSDFDASGVIEAAFSYQRVSPINQPKASDMP